MFFSSHQIVQPLPGEPLFPHSFGQKKEPQQSIQKLAGTFCKP
jgi:hypothetical protein